MSSYPSLGRYEIIEELGKGAMGVVYLAKDPIIGRHVALKTFRVGFDPGDEELQEFRARFIREAQSAGILSHPNIVTIHDVVDLPDRQTTFIAMEYVRGTNLKELLKEAEALSLGRIAHLVDQIASGLDYAHSKGVIHRDVKPANIIIADGWTVKITDFGIARLETSDLTQEGQLLGTPNYMAPERIMGRDVDHRTDGYSLGVVIYELITRQKPFRGDNLTMVTHRIVYDDFTPVERFAPDVPSAVVAVLERSMAKEPADRFQTATELARAFRLAVESAPTMVATLVPGSPEAFSGAETQDVSGHVPLPPRADETVSVPIADELPPTPSTTDDDTDPAIPAATAPPTGGVPDVEGGGEERADQTGFGSLPPVVDLESLGGAGPDLRPLWRVLAVFVFVGLVVGVGWLTMNRSEPVIETVSAAAVPVPASDFAPWREAAQGALANGRPKLAARFLSEALAIAPEDTDLRKLEHLVARTLDAFEGAIGEARRADALAMAREEVAAGRFDEAERALEHLLVEAPDDPDVVAIIADIEAGRTRRAADDRERSARRRAERQSDVAKPTVAPAEEAPEPETFTLAIDFFTEISEGVFVVYADRSQLLNEPFSFNERVNRFKSEPRAGRIEATVELPRGTTTLRVYVTIKGQPTKVSSVEGSFRGGTARTLRVRLDPVGQLTATIE